MIMIIYFIRHFLFTLNRLIGKQRIYYQDIVDSELPTLSVFVPMHNEEKVAADILNRLIAADYPRDKLEVIPINDHSKDKTQRIIDEFARQHPFIKPIHRRKGKRGKPAGLNEAMEKAKGDIAIVFDADYLPPKGILRDMAIAFKDPEVGAMMGRVIPINTPKNLLTRLLDLERSAGYQIDQQARYNLKLIPQYGGTVGAFRREQFINFGGFDENILAEDTELTFNFLSRAGKLSMPAESNATKKSRKNGRREPSRLHDGHGGIRRSCSGIFGRCCGRLTSLFGKRSMELCCSLYMLFLS